MACLCKMNKIKQGRQDPSTLINYVHVFESKQSTILNLRQTSVHVSKQRHLQSKLAEADNNQWHAMCSKQCKASWAGAANSRRATKSPYRRILEWQSRFNIQTTKTRLLEVLIICSIKDGQRDRLSCYITSASKATEQGKWMWNRTSIKARMDCCDLELCKSINPTNIWKG